MLTGLNVATGRLYVEYARRIMREVVQVTDQKVIFITHHMDTGNSCGSASECKMADFLEWAHHEASPAEIASLQYRKRDMLIESSLYSHWDTVETEPRIVL
jgi:hypothetical protein